VFRLPEIADFVAQIDQQPDEEQGGEANGENPEKLAGDVAVERATFLLGFLVALGIVVGACIWHTPTNQSADKITAYHSRLASVGRSGLVPDSPGEKAGLERFKNFLQGIGNVDFVRKNTLETYAADAYLDDTLAIHHGAAEIEAYFVKTSETMTSYKVTINDVGRSGEDYYVRWTMVFAAPALSGGKPVHSIGVSQIRLNREGKVEFHQDFWDSGRNFYEHLPLIGGGVGYVHQRLQAN
jgi:hypothetical protein